MTGSIHTPGKVGALDVSVVVPAYCEASRIEHCLEGLTAWLAGQRSNYEIIVVDDGSSDQTVELVEQFAASHPAVSCIGYEKNRGKGHAVRLGMTQAVGDIVFFTDADLSTAPEEIGKALQAFTRGADVVIGSRTADQSTLVIRQAKLRETMGRTFNVLVRSLGLESIQDTQCGFKGFRREVISELIQPLVIDGFAFDVEMLVRARALGLNIVEIPVRWTNHPASHVRIVRDTVAMLIQLGRIRLRKRELEQRV